MNIGGGIMFRIVDKKVMSPVTKLMEIYAPDIAAKAEPGQFIMLTIDAFGERIPLTIADFDRQAGTVTVVFQEVGNTTKRLGLLDIGDSLKNFAGPLGNATELGGIKKVVIIGGGLGTAIAYPQAKKLYNNGAEITSILGFRSSEHVIMLNEMEKVSHKLFLVTDDGSSGEKGFVTNVLSKLLLEGEKYDAVIAIGPVVMMRAVCNVTRPYEIKTIVSMNPIMIDGTGMCGGCRVTVDGKVKFACIDGPDFDGHKVDFDEAVRRQAMYKREETIIHDKHICKIGREGHEQSKE